MITIITLYADIAIDIYGPNGFQLYVLFRGDELGHTEYGERATYQASGSGLYSWKLQVCDNNGNCQTGRCRLRVPSSKYSINI